jgi:hypothetical protein
VNKGHAEHFCVGVLKIIEASERVVGEARGCSVDEIEALGVLKNLQEDLPLSIVVVKKL